jgi:glycerol-3-phosphate dehydrogenase
MAARRALLGVSAAAAATAGIGSAYVALGAPEPPLADAPWADVSSAPRSRRAHLEALRASGRAPGRRGRKSDAPNEPFDILIIGGGATGAGAALDAATRGLRVALVEGEDFASGTSSRSTKLVHGGVRYLEKAVFQLDPGQLKLVFEALRERRTLLRNAPHLAWPLPIATPCYKAWEVPYYWAGMKAYDLVAFLGGGSLEMSKFLTARESLAAFPNLALTRSDDPEKNALKGAVVYRDGQFDDARLAVALAATASAAGATVLNHARVDRLLFEEVSDEGTDGISTNETGTPRVTGALVRDVSGSRKSAPFPVRARCVINATGPFTDGVRRMVDARRETIMTPAGGTHVVLPAHFAPETCGLIVPKTKDGRVVFLLPWLGGVVAGTTDAPAPVTLAPRPSAEEVGFILEAVAPYLAAPARREDVLSAWSGIRPLATPPREEENGVEKGTENVSRDHVVADEGDGVVTVTGGKWTTYRLMAEHAVDAAVRVAAKADASVAARAGPCVTDAVAVLGAHGHRAGLAQTILMENARGVLEDSNAKAKNKDARRFTKKTKTSGREARARTTLDDADVVEHLVRAYGDRARRVVDLARSDDALAKRLAPAHPTLVAEVVHAAREEYCLTTRDFLARRSRLAFLDVAAAEAAAPAVNAALAKELGWGWFRAARELRDTRAFLRTFRC